MTSGAPARTTTVDWLLARLGSNVADATVATLLRSPARSGRKLNVSDCTALGARVPKAQTILPLLIVQAGGCALVERNSTPDKKFETITLVAEEGPRFAT